MQVRDLCFHSRLFLTYRTDTVIELVTFPFAVLRNVLQPILPKRLLQMPPIRKIIHKCAFQAESIFFSF